MVPPLQLADAEEGNACCSQIILKDHDIEKAMVPSTPKRSPLCCKQTWVTLVGDKSLGRGFHNFQRIRGLGGQGAELDILRHWDLRGWGGKMHPAGSGGKMVLSSGPVFARPRLSALIPLTPEPRHGGGHRAIGFDDRSCPDSQVIGLPMFVDRTIFY
jgi:hypothetical protein